VGTHPLQPSKQTRLRVQRRLMACAASFLLAAGCRSPRISIAKHSTTANLSFEIQGSATHLDVVACDDSNRILWAADATRGSLPAHLRFESATMLAVGCYMVRIKSTGHYFSVGNRRYFEVHENGIVIQQL